MGIIVALGAGYFVFGAAYGLHRLSEDKDFRAIMCYVSYIGTMIMPATLWYLGKLIQFDIFSHWMTTAMFIAHLPLSVFMAVLLIKKAIKYILGE